MHIQSTGTAGVGALSNSETTSPKKGIGQALKGAASTIKATFWCNHKHDGNILEGHVTNKQIKDLKKNGTRNEKIDAFNTFYNNPDVNKKAGKGEKLYSLIGKSIKTSAEHKIEDLKTADKREGGVFRAGAVKEALASAKKVLGKLEESIESLPPELKDGFQKLLNPLKKEINKHEYFKSQLRKYNDRQQSAQTVKTVERSYLGDGDS